MKSHPKSQRDVSRARRARGIALIAVTAATALTLTACAAGTGTAGSTTAQKTISLVTAQPVNDHGVMQDLVAGYDSETKAKNVKKNVVVLSDPSTYTSTLDSVAARSDMVITTFPPMAQPLQQVAEKYPHVKFVLLDATLTKPLPNVQELFFHENESSYLAGIVAARETKTNKVGFLGALKQDVIDRYLAGFAAGVKSVNPATQVCYAYVGNLSDPALGKQFATTMYGQGVDVIHAATAGSEVGVYQAAEELHKYLIGADVDVRPFAPNYGLTAAGPDFRGAAVLSIDQFLTGQFKNGVQSYGLKDGAVRLLPYNDKLVPSSVQQEVATAKQSIIDGKITVPDDKSVANLQNCS
ncbi:BMP family protein [Leifsonia sp. NPDC056665]|uniref:BMP family lipoprotein n=1 Tax=Leifsonia sp. NPDC056665 TaxID=3345901 RepID=UPI0036C14B5D